MTARRIRRSREAPFFALWRDPAVLGQLAYPQLLTTARYEPILRRSLGGGHIDLLFESGETSCVLGGIRLDPDSLITRERSPIVWPAAIAATLGEEQLLAIEETIVPWLRAIARGRAMATESIRSFVSSSRFERARAAGLVGAVPLERSMPAMAPFVFARRFASGAHVALGCTDAPLAQAVLADIAASFAYGEGAQADAFALAWYGFARPEPAPGRVADLAIVDCRGAIQANVVIERTPAAGASGAIVEVPSPAPWDVLFSFDTADAPAASHFGVTAIEPQGRVPEPLAISTPVGGSSGVIVLAVSPEALAMRGADIEEVEIFGRRLGAEGFTVYVVNSTADPALADAQLVHIFGAPSESDTIAFAEHALARGVEFVFDLPPQASDSSAFAENAIAIIHRAAKDDAELQHYLLAFQAGRIDRSGTPPEPSAEEYARTQTRFGELAQRAAAVLVPEEDRAGLVALFPPAAARVFARGVFAEAEPDPAAIGHLAPRQPFALVHGPIGARSHLLPVAFGAELHRVPLVITGPVYDVDYLQTLRATAPNAIVLADAAAAVVSALYRQAAVFVDAAPRPRSAAGLLRAVACGALPVLAQTSPLTRIAGAAAPTFVPTSADDCGVTLARALTPLDRSAPIAELRGRLLARRDPAATLRGVLAAYSRAATAV
jgi:hypothetical protein